MSSRSESAFGFDYTPDDGFGTCNLFSDFSKTFSFDVPGDSVGFADSRRET